MDTSASTNEAGLEHLGSYKINRSPNAVPFTLVISGGSVVDFTHKNPSKAAIVNAANEECLGGGGVDGAISAAGGPNLLKDRLALPLIRSCDDDDSIIEGYQIDVRCPTGDAKLTGPGDYGNLQVCNVIHAVGPNYISYESCLEEADSLLRSAYVQTLERAKEAGLEAVAFCLLSAGIFRGDRSLDQVLRIAVEAIHNFGGYVGLDEVHLCAFNVKEADALTRIAEDIGESSIHPTSGMCTSS